ncbi:MAG: tetratricopeptide repeat protein [Gemmatimonadetes bacterium]|nr:tetratricopeptide repeat protein [Gemmatimonadota bacterium]
MSKKGWHIGCIALVLNFGIFWTSAPIWADPAAVDSLYLLGNQALKAGEIDRAKILFEQSLKTNKKHAPTHCGLGHVYLTQDQLSKARKAFRNAEKYRRKMPEAYFGMGLVYAREKGQWVRAIDYFCRALAEKPDYVEAQYHIGLTHLNLMNRDAIRAFEQVVEMDPDHPDAYYRLGFMYEYDLLKKDGAIEYYEKQLAVNPAHKDAMWRLGQLYRTLSRTDQAARTLSRLMQTQGTNQRQYMLELAEVYLERKNYEKAETLFETYIAGLSTRERTPYEDISLLASERETEAFQQAKDRQVLLQQFWKRRDPTPITDVNERRVEHFRRVAYAREHFGTAVFPWDRRGEVYVRYGTPSHKSASEDRQRESHPEDWDVKQRLLDRVDWAAEILLSDYAADSDSANVTHRGAGAEQAQRQLERQFQRLYNRSSERNQKSEQIRKRAESAMAVGGLGAFLGRPIFPIQDRRAWEYWIYPGLGEGVEIAFRQMPGAPDGVFDYAVLPAEMATKMRHLWEPLIPEQIISQAPREIYVPAFLAEPLYYAAYPATFRGLGDSTRLEIYYGFPASALTRDGGDVRINRGAVLYNAKGDPVFKAAQRAVLRVDGKTGIIPDVIALDVKPGSYYLAVQAIEERSGRTQVYGMPLRVPSYRHGKLWLSDIEMAASIEQTTGKGHFVKQNLEVIPLATRHYTQRHLIYLYYEIYGLSQDAFGQTDYQISYRLKPRSGQSFGAKVLGGLGKLVGIDQNEEQIAISYDQTGDADNVVNYLALDLSGSEPGEYVIEVAAMDRKDGQKVTKTASFKLETPDEIE